MLSREKVSLIIPAYNEADRIGDVIEPAIGYFSEIIVIDDGSTDGTHKIASDYEVTVLRHSENRGKGEAMQSGYEKAKALGSTALLFLDADLRGLTTAHIDSLVRPVLDEAVPMTIGILDRTWVQMILLKKWGALSGQRAMPIGVWEQLDPQFRTNNRVEAGLNLTAQYNGWNRQIRRIELEGVTHTGQWEKQNSLLKAILVESKTYGTAALTYAQMWLEHCAGKR